MLDTAAEILEKIPVPKNKFGRPPYPFTPMILALISMHFLRLGYRRLKRELNKNTEWEFSLSKICRFEGKIPKSHTTFIRFRDSLGINFFILIYLAVLLRSLILLKKNFKIKKILVIDSFFIETAKNTTGYWTRIKRKGKYVWLRGIKLHSLGIVLDLPLLFFVTKGYKHDSQLLKPLLKAWKKFFEQNIPSELKEFFSFRFLIGDSAYDSKKLRKFAWNFLKLICIFSRNPRNSKDKKKKSQRLRKIHRVSIERIFKRLKRLGMSRIVKKVKRIEAKRIHCCLALTCLHLVSITAIEKGCPKSFRSLVSFQ